MSQNYLIYKVCTIAWNGIETSEFAVSSYTKIGNERLTNTLIM